jgi:hypothetical protein
MKSSLRCTRIAGAKVAPAFFLPGKWANHGRRNQVCALFGKRLF